MNKIKDGGPAYPVPNSANQNGQEGMSLRDHFAGLAMQALMHPGVARAINIVAEERELRVPVAIGIAAYEQADALLEAQEKKPLKDHEISAIVNELRDIAIKYHDAQQLRECIAAVVVPALRGERKP
jgi:hypothetical protein